MGVITLGSLRRGRRFRLTTCLSSEVGTFLLSGCLCAVIWGCGASGSTPSSASSNQAAAKGAPERVQPQEDINQRKEGFTLDLHAKSLQQGANGYIVSAFIQDADLVKLSNDKEGKHYPLKGATYEVANGAIVVRTPDFGEINVSLGGSDHNGLNIKMTKENLDKIKSFLAANK